MTTKIKYYLRGLGTGIIITTLILVISFNFGERADVGKSTETTTQKEEKTTEKGTTTKKEEKTTIKETTTKKEETTEKETTTKKENTTPKETEPQETTEPPSDAEKVTFTVQSGMTSNTVADILEELGVVKDGNDFNMYLYNNGYESRIRVGTFEVNKGADYAEIAAIITGR